MKPYILALAAGLLVGAIYALVGVRSPAPPVIGLVGLLGILLGEQLPPIVQRAARGHSITAFLREGGRSHVLGKLPSNRSNRTARDA